MQTKSLVRGFRGIKLEGITNQVPTSCSIISLKSCARLTKTTISVQECAETATAPSSLAPVVLSSTHIYPSVPTATTLPTLKTTRASHTTYPIGSLQLSPMTVLSSHFARFPAAPAKAGQIPSTLRAQQSTGWSAGPVGGFDFTACTDQACLLRPLHTQHEHGTHPHDVLRVSPVNRHPSRWGCCIQRNG